MEWGGVGGVDGYKSRESGVGGGVVGVVGVYRSCIILSSCNEKHPVITGNHHTDHPGHNLPDKSCVADTAMQIELA